MLFTKKFVFLVVLAFGIVACENQNDTSDLNEEIFDTHLEINLDSRSQDHVSAVEIIENSYDEIEAVRPLTTGETVAKLHTLATIKLQIGMKEISEQGVISNDAYEDFLFNNILAEYLSEELEVEESTALSFYENSLNLNIENIGRWSIHDIDISKQSNGVYEDIMELVSQEKSIDKFVENLDEYVAINPRKYDLLQLEIVRYVTVSSYAFWYRNAHFYGEARKCPECPPSAFNDVVGGDIKGAIVGAGSGALVGGLSSGGLGAGPGAIIGGTLGATGGTLVGALGHLINYWGRDGNNGSGGGGGGMIDGGGETWNWNCMCWINPNDSEK